VERSDNNISITEERSDNKAVLGAQRREPRDSPIGSVRTEIVYHLELSAE